MKSIKTLALLYEFNPLMSVRLRPHSYIFKDLLQNHLANHSQISCGASM